MHLHQVFDDGETNAKAALAAVQRLTTLPE
jgi:hypothetical protein